MNMLSARVASMGILAACLLAGTTTARAASQTATLEQDAFVTSSFPGRNYGGAGALGVSGPSNTNGIFDSVIRFDLASVKSSFDTTYGAGLWSVQSITLQLTATPPNNAIFNAQNAGQFSVVWMQNDSWVEGGGTPNSQMNAGSGITYTSLPTFLGANDQALGTFTFTNTGAASVTYTLGPASGILGDIAAGGKASFELLAGSNSMSYLFNSRTGATPPLLTINAVAVPEPAEWLIMGIGCGLLAFFRQRRLRHGR